MYGLLWFATMQFLAIPRDSLAGCAERDEVADYVAASLPQAWQAAVLRQTNALGRLASHKPALRTPQSPT